MATTRLWSLKPFHDSVLQRLSRATQQGPDADIRTLVRREFGLRVGQRSVYEEALTHSSMLDGDKSGLKSNERLEFLGDVVLDMTMANYLYKAFPEAQEGELTKRKSRIVNRKNLNLWARTWGCITSFTQRCVGRTSMIRWSAMPWKR